MNKKLLKQFGNPLGWLYVILVVCLLVIISNNSKTITGLERDLATTKQLGQQQVDAMQLELAVRDDAIMGMRDEVDMLDSMLDRTTKESKANYDAYTELKGVSESLNEDLDNAFILLSNTEQELQDTKTLLDVCMAQPTQ